MRRQQQENCVESSSLTYRIKELVLKIIILFNNLKINIIIKIQALFFTFYKEMQARFSYFNIKLGFSFCHTAP